MTAPLKPRRVYRREVIPPSVPTASMEAHHVASIRAIAADPARLAKDGTVGRMLWELFTRRTYGTGSIKNVALMFGYPKDHVPGDRINDPKIGGWTVWLKAAMWKNLVMNIPAEGRGIRYVDCLGTTMYVYFGDHDDRIEPVDPSKPRVGRPPKGPVDPSKPRVGRPPKDRPKGPARPGRPTPGGGDPKGAGPVVGRRGGRGGKPGGDAP